MSDDGDFLRRWSRRKTASKAGPAGPLADAVPAEAGSQTPQPTKDTPPAEVPATLPPIDSLTPDSDFTPFMQSGVDPGVKREALKTLLRDPRFNVMDGLDVYIDDYSKPDPLPVEWLDQLNQLKRLGHYLEATEKEAPEDPGQGAEEPQKAMQEQAVAFPENTSQPDTSSEDSQSPE
jgi:hypothetical protein